MSLPSKLLDATQVDIDRLVADKAREGPHLDFKRELPATWDEKAKHRFLADATAFANAGGGDILFGDFAFMTLWRVVLTSQYLALFAALWAAAQFATLLQHFLNPHRHRTDLVGRAN